MTADELISHLATDCEQTEDVIHDFFQALSGAVEEHLSAGDGVVIPGLGTLHIYRPATGTRSILVQWSSDEGLRRRVTEALNARDGRTPIPHGQAQRIRNGKGIAKIQTSEGRGQRAAARGAR
jgi:cytosine/adenosine deaminase-related metal-dependent hydrolase